MFIELLDSSLMAADVETRWLFLTMLLIADEARTGIVDMPIEALAARARLSMKATRAALLLLKMPDPTSKCQLHEGRRVVPLERPEGFDERGWLLPSWPEHRERMRKILRQTAVREAVARHREKRVISSNQVKSGVTKTNTSKHSRAEAEQSKADSSPSISNPKSERARAPAAPRAPKFTPPTFDAVADFWASEDLDGDAEEFFDHHENCGWRLASGRGALMRSWQLAARMWSRRQAQFVRKTASEQAPQVSYKTGYLEEMNKWKRPDEE